MPKLTAAVLLAVAVALALTLAPVRAADTATADDTAHFLAGLPPATNSPLAALTGDARWQHHARYFDAIFEREDATTLSQGSRLCPGAPGRQARHHAVHVQRA